MRGHPGVVTVQHHTVADLPFLLVPELGVELMHRLFQGVPEHMQYYANDAGELCLRPYTKPPKRKVTPRV